MIEQLITSASLRQVGLWSDGDKPSVRTLQNWMSRRCLPCTFQGGRRFLPLVELQHFFQRCHRWPISVARRPAVSLFQLRLIRFNTLRNSSIWHPTSRPCTRTLRTWVRLGEIPHYRIGRSVFFSLEEVEHCLITAKLIAAA